MYDSTKTYNTGDTAYYAGLFWLALLDGVLNVTPGTNALKWQKNPSDDVDNYVADEDITRAFSEAQVSFNQALFGSDAEIQQAYLYLTAHYMALDIRTAMGGVFSTGENPMNSRTVGSVSESYTIPQAYLDDPVLVFYTKTGYGMKYLNFILPRVRGNFGVVHGWTLP